MDEFLYENYRAIPNINGEVLHTSDYILVNCSEEKLAETVMDKAYINKLKQGQDHVIEISFEELRSLNTLLTGTQQEKSETGIGLTNINNRLRLFYSEKYMVHVESQEGKWTLVTFQIPK